MRCNSGKADLGHPLFNLDCFIKEPLFARVAEACDSFALGE